MRGYRSPYWFTFRQALAINAPVAKGEKGSPAILYKTGVVGAAAEAEAPGGDESADAKVLRYLKTYTVFNAVQLTDCPACYIEVVKPDPAARSAVRNAVLDAIPARIEFGGGQACYVPARDMIRLPRPEAFDTVDDFLATKAHEQLHDAERRIMPRGRRPGLATPRASGVIGRHIQGASRKARSRSSGRYRPGGKAGAAMRWSACSFSFMSACR